MSQITTGMCQGVSGHQLVFMRVPGHSKRDETKMLHEGEAGERAPSCTAIEHLFGWFEEETADYMLGKRRQVAHQQAGTVCSR